MTNVEKRASVVVPLTSGQVVLCGLLLCAIGASLYFFGGYLTLKGVVGAAILFYLVSSGFKHCLAVASGFHRYPSYVLPSLNDSTLPKVSILIALRDEAGSIGNLVASIMRLEYPTWRLQVLLLIDEDDTDTLMAAARLGLPNYIEVVKVPDAGPRMKPKALIWGYKFIASDSQIIVPFDAEDRIPPDQILHAVATFRARPTDRHGRRIGGAQARLTFWNPRGVKGRSWVSSLVYAEYCVQYLHTLPGMERLGIPYPYGGTSCYFLRDALDAVTAMNGEWKFPHRKTGALLTFRGPWDLNPTEDADLTWRMLRCGWGNTLINSTTNEEAPNRLLASGHQGTRWVHGYWLTWLVSIRKPVRTMRKTGPLSWMGFNLFMLGTPLSLILNPITWGTTILYIVSRYENWTGVSSYIHGLFPAPIFYIGLLVGAANFSVFLQSIFAVLKAQEMSEREDITDPLSAHRQGEQYGITLRVALATLPWWVWRSISAWRATFRLLRPKNNLSWTKKTPHGAAGELEEQLTMPELAL